MPSPQVLLFSADDEPPAQGLYSVTLRRGCVERALGIICNNGLWSVFLDGEQYCEPSQNWRDAFGRLYQQPLMKGRKLSVNEYRKLYKKRLADKLNGIDLSKPLDQTKTEIAI